MPEVNEIKRARWGQKLVWIPCIDCGNPRWVQFVKGHPLNLRCKRCSQKGKRSLAWKDEMVVNGYVLIHIPEHPYAHKDGYVKRARLVLEEKLGRYLKEGYEPHHLNEIKDDDRPENLEERSHEEHTSLHWQRRRELASSRC